MSDTLCRQLRLIACGQPQSTPTYWPPLRRKHPLGVACTPPDALPLVYVCVNLLLSIKFIIMFYYFQTLLLLEYIDGLPYNYCNSIF